jgi:hypothetical protein
VVTDQGQRSPVADDKSVPDPLAGLRAMTAVQRAGIEAAATVVERMLELGRLGIRGPLPFPLPAEPMRDSERSRPSESDDPGRELRRLRGDAERMLELWGEWIRLLLDAAADSAESAVKPTNGRADHLLLGPAKPGTRPAGRAWLHVLDGPPTAAANLTATAFTAHDGSAIEGSAITFDPPTLDTFALRSSQEIAVTVDVPTGTAPGIYHGHILATGLPELSLAVRIEVSPER